MLKSPRHSGRIACPVGSNSFKGHDPYGSLVLFFEEVLKDMILPFDGLP